MSLSALEQRKPIRTFGNSESSTRVIILNMFQTIFQIECFYCWLWALFVCWVWVFYILIVFRLNEFHIYSFTERILTNKRNGMNTLFPITYRNVGYVSHKAFHSTFIFFLSFTRIVLLVIIFTIWRHEKHFRQLKMHLV